MHGAGPAMLRQLERQRDVFAEPRRLLGDPRGLGDGSRGTGLVHLLEGAPARLSGRRVSAQQHHGRFRHQRAVERRERVQVPGPRRHERDAGLFPEPAPRVRHVHGRRFVARVDDADVAPDGCVVDGEDPVAGEREEVTHARGGERADDEVGPACRHGEPSARGRARRRATPPRPLGRGRRTARPPCC